MGNTVKVKVRVIVSNSSTAKDSSNVAKGHKHLSFLAGYFKSNNSTKKEYSHTQCLVK